MKNKLLKTTAVAMLFLSCARASSYIVPPDIDDLRNSVKSPTIVAVTSTSPVRKSFNIILNGSYQNVTFRCETVPKIACRAGSPSVFATVEKYQAFTSDSTPKYLPISITGYDIKVAEDANNYYICVVLASTDGNALLTEKNANGGTTYDRNNPSNAIVEVRQICR